MGNQRNGKSRQYSQSVGTGIYIPLSIAIGGMFLAYFLSHQDLPGAPFPWENFFRHLFLSQAVFYSLYIAWSCVTLPRQSYLRPVIGISGLSMAVSFLSTADAVAGAHLRTGAIPESFSGLIYVLLTERQALLALSLFGLALGVVATYYVLRSFFAVEYTGVGIQIRLPGQVVYYLPVYPQISWQDTGIVLKKGEKVSIELSGHVSPGELQSFDDLKKHMETFEEWQKSGAQTERWGEVHQVPSWPYTTPAGYKESWYVGEDKLEVMKRNPIYCEDHFYLKDPLLTVQGLPHNHVLGIIRAFGEPPPRDARMGKRAYNWKDERDAERLLYLSSDEYPISIEAKQSGHLWVVINDVDEARWDNRGMFFLRLTRHSWLSGV